jgi:outer membrane protein insertion porin family
LSLEFLKSSVPLRAAALVLALLAFLGAAPAGAADINIGPVPIHMGEGDERRGTVSMDMSKLTASGDVPLSDDARPARRARRERLRIEAPAILAVSVEGNHEVVASHILSVASSKPGQPMDQNRLTRDVDAIYQQGFYSNVDYRIVDKEGGVDVIFTVTENPKIDSIHFFGNTTYTEAQLADICFTKPGMIFNRVFFRNDLQRIKEKYQQDGYVMARVSDVKIEGRDVNVYITEPRLGDILIQGNKRTKSYVIERQLRFKKGDLFNATRLRYSLSKLQGLGYFDDVSVGFEPGGRPDMINLVLTVSEAKTGRIGISIGYGTESGLSGGISYGDNNWLGRGQRLGVGFDIGDREQYWLTLDQPYMDQKTYAWRAGAYKRSWDDLRYYDDDIYQFEYDEERIGGYLGVGRKFSARSKLNWFLTTEWQDIKIYTHDGVPTPHQLEEMESGKNFTVTGRLTRDNLDEYSDYPKGDIESIMVEKGLDALGGEWSYWKYWIEAKYYAPLNFLPRLFERSFTINNVPPIFAARVIAGDSSGYIPWAVDYTVGGDKTLRGYEDKRFRGDQMFLANAELRMPVHKSASLVLFYDVGKAWDTTNEGEKFDLGDLADAYGIGFRIRTPLGNLRLDVAQGDDESKVHFGFGEMF